MRDDASPIGQRVQPRGLCEEWGLRFVFSNAQKTARCLATRGWWNFWETLLGFFEGGLGGCEACYGDAERCAAHIVKADLVAELEGIEFMNSQFGCWANQEPPLAVRRYFCRRLLGFSGMVRSMRWWASSNRICFFSSPEFVWGPTARAVATDPSARFPQSGKRHGRWLDCVVRKSEGRGVFKRPTFWKCAGVPYWHKRGFEPGPGRRNRGGRGR